MRSADGVATHVSEHSQPVPLQAIGQRRADAGMVMMVAGSFQLHALAVQEEAFVRIPQ